MQGEGEVVLRNVGNRLSSDEESYSKRMETATTRLWEPSKTGTVRIT